ncbi:MAG: hypothetical protein ACFFF4_15560 [Candidatus Thorarchaeota archaeon]
MQRYNREIRRLLIVVVILAALLASTVLVAALFSEQPQFIDDDLGMILLPVVSVPIILGAAILVMVLLVNRKQ